MKELATQDVLGVWPGGVNSSVSPDLLPDDQLSWAVNVSLRGGRAKPRQAWVDLGDIPFGTFQGGTYYSAADMLVVSVNGVIYSRPISGSTWEPVYLEDYSFTVEEEGTKILPLWWPGWAIFTARIRPTNATALDLKPGALCTFIDPDGQVIGQVYYRYHGLLGEAVFSGPRDLHPVNTEGTTIPAGSTVRINVVNSRLKHARNYFCETPSGLIIQDGRSRPVIFTGTTARFAKDDEVPVATCMHYANGRLAVALSPTGRVLRIGDVAGTAPGSELKFTEHRYLLGGGDIVFPGRIRFLSSLPVLDTSSGQGPLIVATDDAIYTVKTNIPDRDRWQYTPGFVTSLLEGVGGVSDRAVQQDGSDLWFIATDGLRTLRLTVQDASDPAWTPLSAGVRRTFGSDPSDMMRDSSLALWDNRVLATAFPTLYGQGQVYQRLVSLNLEGVTTALGQTRGFAWEGVWDGHQVLQLIATGHRHGVRRCFAVVYESSNLTRRLALKEIPRETDASGGEDPTYYYVETRSVVGAGVNVLKRLVRADVWVSDIETETRIRLFWRKTPAGPWFFWAEHKLSPVPVDPNRRAVPVRSRSRVSVGEPEGGDLVGGVDDFLLSAGHRFQFRVEVFGSATIDLLSIWTLPILSDPEVVDNPDAFLDTPDFEAYVGKEVGFWNEWDNLPYTPNLS